MVGEYLVVYEREMEGCGEIHVTGGSLCLEWKVTWLAIADWSVVVLGYNEEMD